jgi:HEAT repeat protein
MPTLETLLAEITSGDEARAEAASAQFPNHGENGIVTLARLLENEDADLRWWAIRTLSRFKHPQTREYFHRGLTDADIAVQQCAALALRENPDPRSFPTLIDLLGHPDQMLARLAGDALIAAGKEATPTLLDIVENGSQASRLEAVRALAFIEDQRSIPTLLKLIDEDSILICYWAEEGLTKMGVGMVFFIPE